MDVHYENFPVASWVLPRRVRKPILVIYWFARMADDYADEGDFSPAERLEKLEGIRTELDAIQSAIGAGSTLGQELNRIIQNYRLPLQPFYDLLKAFEQDTQKKRYRTYQEILNYCQFSANPVGLLLLHLFEATRPEQIAWSNAICSGLQLVNFYQDIALDLQKDRIYLALEELAEFGLGEEDIGPQMIQKCPDRWKAFYFFQIERAENMLRSGIPLLHTLSGRSRLEVAGIVSGGLAICKKLYKTDGDVFTRRPTLDWIDRLMMLGKAALLAYARTHHDA